MMPLGLAQALELAQVMETEACWENLRKHRSVNHGRNGTDALAAAQRAYNAYHSRLVGYNRRNRPEHIPELLLNTANRLGHWCAATGDLFTTAGADPTVACPVSLVEKAFRCAENIATRLRRDPPSRRTPPQTVQAAVEELRFVAAWCSSLEQAAAS